MPSAAQGIKRVILRVIAVIRKVRNHSNSRPKLVISVSPKNCMRVPRIQSTKPRLKRPCKSQSPCPRWRRTSWTPCSTKCGIGYQTRQLKCQLRHTRRIIDTDKCESLPKVNLLFFLLDLTFFVSQKYVESVVLELTAIMLSGHQGIMAHALQRAPMSTMAMW